MRPVPGFLLETSNRLTTVALGTEWRIYDVGGARTVVRISSRTGDYIEVITDCATEASMATIL